MATACRQDGRLSPLAGGVLSGKFTRPGGAESGSRIAGESLGDHDRMVASAVQEVADGIGATASQVALVWVMSRSSRIHPIVGARRLDQLVDNLGAVDCALPDDALARLDAAAPLVAGFPTDFIAETGPWVFGPTADRTDPRD